VARWSSSAGIPMRSGAGIGEGELGEDFGPTAERRWCLALAEVLRIAEYTAAQGGFCSELQDAMAARVWGCAGMGDEVQGVTGVRFKESGRGFRGIRAVECGRDARRGSRVSGHAEGERKEGDDTWGRAVSGRRVS
jgi:hypothetical protein